LKAIIIAAGEGTRLAPYTDIIPKIMFPVWGVPIGSRIVHRLAASGFNDITICVNQKWYGYISDYFIHHKYYSPNMQPVNINFSSSEGAQGTAMEVKNIRPKIDKDFLIWYGDVLTEGLYDNLEGLHYMRKEVYGDKYIGTLVVQDKLNTEVGLLKVKDDVITSFDEKAQLSQYSWSAIAILRPKVLDFVNKNDNDFGHHVFPKLLQKGFILKSYVNKAMWTDVGNLQSYKKANQGYYDR
jgi:NDP-sugar pyrophosphorylase family protein